MNEIITPPHQERKRLAGLDVVRAFACLSVITSHFFLFSDFNSTSPRSMSMFLQGVVQSFTIGSDIYMMLTGFLCVNKPLSLKFYKSGGKVLFSYLLFSILTIAFGIYVLENGKSWIDGIKGIFSYSAIAYAWYIEMWIGLFLMAPFLNVWYKSLPDRKMKIWLIATLFMLTAPADFLNRYGMYWWPQFWVSIYPICFYFIGCYLREYKPVVKWWKLLIAIIAIAVVNPLLNVVVGMDKPLHIVGGRNGLFMMPMAVLIFMLLYQVDLKGSMAKGIFKHVALVSLDVFLCSATFDVILYPILRKHFFVDQNQFGWYLPVCVGCVFLCSFAVASLKRGVWEGIKSTFRRKATEALSN